MCTPVRPKHHIAGGQPNRLAATGRKQPTIAAQDHLKAHRAGHSGELLRPRRIPTQQHRPRPPGPQHGKHVAKHIHAKTIAKVSAIIKHGSSQPAGLRSVIMRAARIHEYGGPAVIRLDDIAPPVPGPGEVLIKVAATSLNPTETALRSGHLAAMFALDLPLTLGWDIAGTILAGPAVAGPAVAGPGVGGLGVDGPVLGGLGVGGLGLDGPVLGGSGVGGSGVGDSGVAGPVVGGPVLGGLGVRGLVVGGWAIGEPVIGMVDAGAAAEFAVAPVAVLVRAPTTVPLADAAALPLAGMTAWQAVFEHAQIKPGERVLINGGGGGIGGFAVQLARHAGAYVLATASPRSAPTVRSFGADEVLDYTAGPLAVGEPVDAVVNCAAIPSDAAAALVPLVRPGGRIVTVATPIAASGSVTAWHMVVRNDPADLAALVALVDAGVIQLDITGRRRLANLPDLHQLSESGATHGKIIVTP